VDCDIANVVYSLVIVLFATQWQGAGQFATELVSLGV
jgi:hypothetical protein